MSVANVEWVLRLYRYLSMTHPKKAEADEFLGNYYATFFGIPGFTYSIGTWFEIKEAFKMIGLG